MNKGISALGIIVAVLAIIVVLSCAYTIDETQQVVITQFGEPIGDPIKAPGLHFKVPVIQKATYFDDRVLEWDGDPNRIPTKDKKYIFIDSTARWRIVDPLLFLKSVHDERQAQSRLDDIIDSEIRNVISSHKLIEIVRDTNRIVNEKIAVDELSFDQQFEIVPDGSGREVITREMLKRAQPTLKQSGIELLDVRIKRINYDPQVRNKVFERMISERKRAAEFLRSQGYGEKANIEGKKEKELQRIRSEAYRQAEIVRGKADAEAIKIYADSYSKDPEFYSFVKTLESYHQALAKQSTLILTTDSEYFKYLKDTTPSK